MRGWGEYDFNPHPEPERWLTRAELGLPTDKKLYVCPMAIQKFHPDYDVVLAQILARDPEAVLVLFMDFQRESATEMMQARLFKTCDRTRIIFMPWLKLEALFSVLKVADAVLDTIYLAAAPRYNLLLVSAFPSSACQAITRGVAAFIPITK